MTGVQTCALPICHVIRHEIDVTRHQLMRNRIEMFEASAGFVDANTVRMTNLNGKGHRDVSAGAVVIACGTHATKDAHIPFDGQRVFISDDILTLEKLPRSLAVIGAGVIGCEYATIFAALGIRVTLIDKRTTLLPFIDTEITQALAYHMHQNRVTLRLGEGVSGVEVFSDERGQHVRIKLESGKQVVTEIGRAHV